MRYLTNLWGSFDNLPFDKGQFIVTKYLFLNKLDDPEKKNKPIYLGINTLSGAIDIFTKEEGETLESLAKEGASVNCPLNFLMHLKKRGYLFPNGQVEDLTRQMIVNHYKHKKALEDKIIAFFLLDTSCAMGCKYCWERKYLGKELAKMSEKAVMNQESLKSAFSTLDFLQDMHRKEIDWVAGYGGEPLQEQHPCLNELFIDCAKKRKWPIVYFSNLAQIGDDLLNLLKDNAEHIRFVQTTLDGLEERHNQIRSLPDAFKRTAANIDKLVKFGIPVIARTNIGPNNYDHVPELASFYESKGWFDLPNFRSIVHRVIDRYHELDDTFTEDKAMSTWLKLNDEYPLVRKMYNYEISYVLHNILDATRYREVTGSIFGIDDESFKVDSRPLIAHCPASMGVEYAFTGPPENSIYPCATNANLLKYKLGSHYPYLSLDTDAIHSMWGSEFYCDTHRTIDTLEKCKNCTSATMCGGYCGLEAITENGCANQVYCNDIPKVITDFLKNESGRMYNRCMKLLYTPT